MPLVTHKYMPEEMPVSELRSTFAVRGHTLDYLVKSIRDQTNSGTLTSFLVTGPRGSGKTTLVLMLAERIKEDDELSAAWHPVRFPEELPGVTSLRDLFESALDVLAAESIDGAQAWLERVRDDANNESSLETAIEGLRSLSEKEGKRWLLIIENLDLLFERGLDAQGESTLRRLLMTEPFMMLLGTAVHMFEALVSYDKAFFNYFNHVPLGRLDDDDVEQLLKRRAEFDGNHDFERIYRQNRPRIRALTRLSGGNPRLVLMLYELLSERRIQPLVTTLRQLVDELTPLLKDVLETLPGQQSKIVHAIMEAGGTATPADIARACRLPLSSVTAQLARLKDRQLLDVRGGGKGRKAHYFVPDQLFRTWYQLRYLRPQRRRIEMFVELLQTWFETGERLAELDRLGLPGLSGQESAPAELLGSALSAEYFAASLKGTEHEDHARDVAVRKYLDAGSVQEAAAVYEDFDKDSNSTGFAAWLNKQAVIRGQGGDPEGAFADCQTVVELAGAPLRHVAKALYNRGVAKWELGDVEGSVKDYTAVVELSGAPVDKVAWALINRGFTKGERGDSEGQVADYTAVVELEGAPVDDVARALVDRGLVKNGLGDSEGAVKDFLSVVELKRAPVDQVARALVNRGFVKNGLGDSKGAVTDFTSVVEMKRGPVDQVARALVNRALVKGQLGDAEGEETDLTAVVELEGAPVDLVARALYNRGFKKGQLGDSEGAVTDYTAAAVLVEKMPPERKSAMVLDFLQGMAALKKKELWPQLWRRIEAGLSEAEQEELRVVGTATEALETGDLSRLDPLPEEERDLALELLRGFGVEEAPEEAVG